MSLKSKFSKKKVLLYAFIAMMAWTYAITVLAQDISSIPYYFQFLLVSGAMYAFPSVILGSLLNNSLRKFAGTWLFLMAFDLISPPLVISLAGKYTKVMLSTASPDFLFYNIWSGFGLNGSMLFLAVYPLTAAILLCLSVAILNEKQIKQLVD